MAIAVRRRSLLVTAAVVATVVVVIVGASLIRSASLSGVDRLRADLHCQDVIEFESDLYQYAPMTGFDCVLAGGGQVSVRQYESADAVVWAWSTWEAPVASDIQALLTDRILVVGPRAEVEPLRSSLPGSRQTGTPSPLPRISERQRTRNACMQAAAAELIDQIQRGAGDDTNSSSPPRLRAQVERILEGEDVRRLRALSARSSDEFEGAISVYGDRLREYCGTGS